MPLFPFHTTGYRYGAPLMYCPVEAVCAHNGCGCGVKQMLHAFGQLAHYVVDCHHPIASIASRGAPANQVMWLPLSMPTGLPFQ